MGRGRPEEHSDKAIPVQGPGGFDAGERVVGRKRVTLVNADGVWAALAVVQDSAFTAERCRDWCYRHVRRHRVVERVSSQRGFGVVEKRWVVERTLT